MCLFSFDPSAFSATFRECLSTVGRGSSADFGYTANDDHALYNYAGGKLYRFVIDTTNWSVSPDPSFNGGQGLFDPDSADCLGGQMAANHWIVDGSALSSDDATIIASIGAGQDVDEYYVAWNATQGCQWLNVRTWTVSNGWNAGPRNGVPISWVAGVKPTAPGGIHNVQIDRSGMYGVLAVHDSGLDHKMFWKIGSNVVDASCVECVSHWACDYGVCFWNHQSQGSSFGMTARTIGSQVTTPNMNMGAARVVSMGSEEHASHANAEAFARNLYLVSWDKRSPTVSAAWEDELVGVSWDGSQRTVRFNKSWTSGLSFWSTARCSISRQGHYALCGSDYQLYNQDRGFGNGFNQDTCDHTLPPAEPDTKGCRVDVLLFELR